MFFCKGQRFISRGVNIYIPIYWNILTEYYKQVKVTLGTFLDFAYSSTSLQTKETVWKQGDAIFSKPEM